MTTQTDFLDIFRGDTLEIKWEDEEDRIHTEEAKVASISQKEPERIEGIPMSGYKQATLEIQNNDGQAKIYWMHMKRDIDTDGIINFGDYEQPDEEDLVEPMWEKRKLGTIREIDVIE